MTGHFYTVTVHCGHGWDPDDGNNNNCKKKAYVECPNKYMLEQLLKHNVEWFCSEHKNEQINNLGDLFIKEL